MEINAKRISAKQNTESLKLKDRISGSFVLSILEPGAKGIKN